MRSQTTGSQAARRAALREKSRPAQRSKPQGPTLLDRLTTWRALAVLASVCVAVAVGAWIWLKPREHHTNPAAMRIAADEFPPEYIAKENLSLNSVAYPQQNLPNTKYDPPRCAEFATQKPFEELGDGKASYGVRRGSDELRTIALGVVDRTVSWDEFAQFAKSCPTFSMTNDFGSGTMSIAPQQPPGSSAQQAVSYLLTTHSAKGSAAKDSSMLVVLAHVSEHTVFAGLTLQSLKPATADQLPDKEAFAKLYATLVQRVEDNS
ncbi:MAG: hypothetical protein ACRC20_07990 [Segniliparus sp.]|uniref:hypothetical protein n=1 Tax=Segniliparus sp. TaxID=2804064 RepID=UPI003F30607F